MLLIDQKIFMEAPGSMCGNRRRLERTVLCGCGFSVWQRFF